MARRYIDWPKIENTIFQKIAEGQSLKAISKVVKVSYSAILSWYRKSGTRRRYNAFLSNEKMPDKRREVIFKVTPMKELDLPRYQQYYLEFKENLKVGDKVKNKKYNEKGVVIAKYPDIFTIRTEYGYLTSYGYNCFMDFEKG